MSNNKVLRKLVRSLITKEKKGFLIIGVVNVLLGNLVLQLLLLKFSIIFATFSGQIISTIFGYFMYGKYVFISRKSSLRSLILFLFLSILLWTSNWLGIKFYINIGISKQIGAILMIPPLACFSYFFQKFYVYKNRVM
tara:strand:- start:703 stop:1116 length:414 start_codon:yes stop_codon:yes gene_type:complete